MRASAEMTGALLPLLATGVALLLFARVWARRRLYVVCRTDRINMTSYGPVAPDAVPAEIRDELERRAEALHALGFATTGYCARAHPELPGPDVVLALYHESTATAASVELGLVGSELGAVVVFRTSFADGAWLMTLAGRAHIFWGEIPGARIVDVPTTNVEEQWRAHLAALGQERRDAVNDGSLEGAAARINHGNEAQRRWLVEHGQATPTADPDVLLPTAAGARHVVAKLTAGSARLARSPLASVRTDLACTPPQTMERYFVISEQARQRIARSRDRMVLFVVTGFLFALPAVVSPAWRELLWVLPAIVIHELGHFVAMRLLGHDDARIFFMPFIGAATATDRPYRKLWHEMVILLAGPLPGLLALPLLLVIRAPWLLHAQMAMIGLSVINLLPIYPLDGGRIVRALLTAGHPRRDTVLRVLGAGAFVAYGAIQRDVLMVVVGAALGAALGRGRRQALLEARIRADLPASARLDPTARRAAIYRALAREARPERLQQHLASIRDLDRRLLDDPPPLRRALPWLLVYAAPLAALAALFALPHTDLLPRLVARRHKNPCPGHERQVAVACTGGRADVRLVDWSAVPSPPASRYGRVDAGRGSGGVVISCSGPGPTALAEMAARLDELAMISDYCAAPPWERAGSDSEERQRRAARATYVRLWRASQADDEDAVTSRVLAAFDAEVAKAGADPTTFDAATAGLLRVLIAQEWKADPQTHDAISARLGRSTAQPCGALRLARARVTRGQGDGARASLVLGAVFDAPSAVAPLGDYLCAAGCALLVTPYAALDYRVYVCD